MSRALRRSAATAALLAAALPIAACGGDDEESGSGTTADAPKSQKLDISVSGSGRNVKVQAPKTGKAGLTDVTFTNNAQGGHSAQLVKVTGDSPAERVLAAGNAWGDKGKPLPSYITFVGGVGTAKQGESGSFTAKLEAGRYLVLDFSEGEGPPAMTELELTGSSEGELPSTDAKVTAREYAFTADGLKTGKNRITFENAGKEPHHLIAAPLKAGKDRDDVVKAVRSEKGAPPIDEKNAVEVPILSGGNPGVVELDLPKPARYALVCFIPDRQGGPPHAIKGMVSVGEVQ